MKRHLPTLEMEYRTHRLAFALAAFGLLVVLSCSTTDPTSRDNPVYTSYSGPFGAISDLSVTDSTISSVTLSWTAPGDSGSAGAISYDLRYSIDSLELMEWDSAAQCVNEPSPGLGGTIESYIVTGLNWNTRYFFAIRSIDDADVVSSISNISSDATVTPIIRVPIDEPTIRDAIAAAEPGYTVIVSSGTYYEADIVLKAGIVLKSEAGRDDCTIDAGSAGRHFYCENLDSLAVIEGFSLDNGKIMGAGEAGSGGSLFVSNSIVRVVDCTISSSVAEQSGGAVYSSNSTLVFERCVISGDSAYSGGAIYSSASNLSLVGCNISDNEAGGNGGALYATIGTSIDVAESYFGRNRSGGNGGAVYAVSSSFLKATQSDFSGGYAELVGGGIYCAQSSLNLDSCSFLRDTAQSEGGALYVTKPLSCDVSYTAFSWNKVIGYYLGSAVYVCCGSPKFSYCNVSGNSVGGIGLDSCVSATIEFSRLINNSTLRGSTAVGLRCANTVIHLDSCIVAYNPGGGISVTDSDIRLDSCVIEGNTGYTGGVLCDRGSAVVSNCRFIGNSNEVEFGEGLGAGALTARWCDLLVEGSVFESNRGTGYYGSSIHCFWSTSAQVVNSTFFANEADVGAGSGGNAVTLDGCDLTMINTIIAAGIGPPIVCNSSDSVDISCSNIFGNSGGDWVGCIASQFGGDNISVDPMFCDPLTGDFGLQPLSPCAPANSPCGELIGAMPVGCSQSIAN